MNNDIMTIDDVARYFKLKPQTIYKWGQEDKIQAVKIGKEWRFKKSVIDKWMDSKFSEKYIDLLDK